MGVKNLDDFISAYSADRQDDDALVFEKVERVTMGERLMYKTKLKPRNFGSDINYYAQLDGELIIEISQYGPLESPQEQKKLETVFSTFKFLK